MYERVAERSRGVRHARNALDGRSPCRCSSPTGKPGVGAQGPGQVGRGCRPAPISYGGWKFISNTGAGSAQRIIRNGSIARRERKLWLTNSSLALALALNSTGKVIKANSEDDPKRALQGRAVPSRAAFPLIPCGPSGITRPRPSLGERRPPAADYHSAVAFL